MALVNYFEDFDGIDGAAIIAGDSRVTITMSNGGDFTKWPTVTFDVVDGKLVLSQSTNR